VENETSVKKRREILEVSTQPRKNPRKVVCHQKEGKNTRPRWAGKRDIDPASLGQVQNGGPKKETNFESLGKAKGKVGFSKPTAPRENWKTSTGITSPQRQRRNGELTGSKQHPIRREREKEKSGEGGLSLAPEKDGGCGGGVVLVGFWWGHPKAKIREGGGPILRGLKRGATKRKDLHRPNSYDQREA